MARQRIHNSRAGRSSNSGASWISYSDMMAALLLVFVLILCISLHQYFQMLEQKSQELEDQRALVSAQQVTLDQQTLQLAAQQVELDHQRSQIIIIQIQLDEQAAELENARIVLADQEAELEAAKAALADRENELIILQSELASQKILLDAATEVLNAQRAALDEQTDRIDDLVGLRARIIADLSNALAANNIRATVDSNTGDIVLDSAVLFNSNSAAILEDGRILLNQFIPLYLSVLFKPEYIDYLGQIIVEGHTDTNGDYISNLELSQNRALNVAKYVLQMPSLTEPQQNYLQKILTSTGRSESDPVYNRDGTVNMAASRRVEFKFSLKDAEMIEELKRLLEQPGN